MEALLLCFKYVPLFRRNGSRSDLLDHPPETGYRNQVRLAGSGEHALGEIVVQFGAELAVEIAPVALREFLRDGVRNSDAFGDGNPVADLAEHAGQRNVQRRADRGQQL